MEVGFIAEGYGVKRYPVMYNDFVLIGPKSDPAGIRGTRYAADALQMIKEKQSLFISRGDRSGTTSLNSCYGTGMRASTSRRKRGAWYIPIGRGMSAALKTAAAMAAYVLSDRSTWPGSVSGTGAILKSLCKATSTCSTSTASSW
jgi:tungstate transport system substrate-binding protein